MQNCIKTVKKKKKKTQNKIFQHKRYEKWKRKLFKQQTKTEIFGSSIQFVPKIFRFSKRNKKKITSKSVLAYVFECVCVFEVEKFVKFNTTTNCLIVSVFVSVCLVHFTSTNYSARRLFT